MTLDVTIARRWPVADRIVAFELRRADGAPLPPFRAGAHIAVQVPGGPTRHYSLAGDETRADHYLIAVQHEPLGRGGSAALHAAADQGSTLAIGEPINTFGLVRDAAPVLLVAGGIGVTPLLSMARALAGRDDVHLHYAVRSESRAAFRDEFAAGRFGRATLYGPGARLDPPRLAAEASPGTRVYLCGPPPFMAAVTQAFETRPDIEVRTEHFGAPAAPVPGDAEAFTVTLARHGLSLAIPPGATILDELRRAGLDPLASCEQGVCGTCATGVLAGEIDHKDYVLSAEEHARGDRVMICVSRGRPGTTLVLDL